MDLQTTKRYWELPTAEQNEFKEATGTRPPVELDDLIRAREERRYWRARRALNNLTFKRLWAVIRPGESS